MKKLISLLVFFLTLIICVRGASFSQSTGLNEAIDLGLPSGLKWASCNIGASKPEEIGEYYAWGEIVPKDNYSIENYKWQGSSKYSRETKRTLDMEDDVANVRLGGEWHIPSMKDIQELIDNCTWEWTDYNGVCGQLVTGPNGNSIFLPASGAYFGSELVTDGGFGGYYQTNTMGGFGPNGYNEEIEGDYSQHLYFYREQYKIWCHSQYIGQVVRPVCGTPQNSMVSVSTNDVGTVEIEGIQNSNAYIVNGNRVTVRAITPQGYFFIGWFLNGSDRIVSTSTTYSFTVNCDINLVAKFKKSVEIDDERAIDLGLPSGTKWAAYNVGANTPEGYGEYYAWGEVESKVEYSWNTYKWSTGNTSSITKYSTNNAFGEVDENFTLDREDDVAYIKWGGEWRMPTKDEWDELLKKCIWKRSTINDTNGYQVTGPNGNSIFIPSCGHYNKNEAYNVGSDGYYWSSSLCDSDNTKAGFLGWNAAGAVCYYYNRYLGKPVRAVCGTPIMYTVSVCSDKRGAVAIKDTEDTYVVRLKGSNATVIAIANDGYEFKGWFEEGSNKKVSTESTYTFEICENINLVAKYYESTTVTETIAVDLGLPSGVKWATCNVGASAAEDVGGLYAWGETEKKDNYSKENYKWYDNDRKTYTKYCTSDKKIVLDSQDDVANVKWGKNWYTPNIEEIQELIDCCTWRWEVLNGKGGYRVTGPNGNNIFLPATGIYQDDTFITDMGTSGYYQTSNLGGYNGQLDSQSEHSQILSCTYGSSILVMPYFHFRYYGQSVRPVYRDNIMNIIDGEFANFYVDENKEKMEITYARTLPNLHWNPLYVPFEIEVEKITDKYEVAYINGVHSYDNDDNGEIDELTMEVIKVKSGTLKANYPYLIKARDEEAKTLNISVEDATLYASTENTIDCSSVYQAFEITGSYSKKSAEELTGKLAISLEGAWQPLAAGTYLNPFRLYMSISDRGGSPLKVNPAALSRVKIVENGETTGIIELTPVTSQKDIIYDLAGRRVMTPQKGQFYIVNGKKVIY